MHSSGNLRTLSTPVLEVWWGKCHLENDPNMTGSPNHAGTLPNLQNLDPVIFMQILKRGRIFLEVTSTSSILQEKSPRVIDPHLLYNLF